MTQKADFDLKLTGGWIADGTGGPRWCADIGIASARIAAVGDLDNFCASQNIDCRGRVVAPGFIDIHTHDDRVVLDAPEAVAKVSQGVTTVVIGNCGVSLAPLAPSGAPPPPFDLLGDPSGFEFPSVDAYRSRVTAQPAAVNVVALVGHGSLRLDYMSALDRPATDPELSAMRDGLQRALRQGASGLSTGLAYAPSQAATTDEVIALARVAAAEGGFYATHMRDEADGVAEALEEALWIGRSARIPVLISHHKVMGPQNFGRSLKTLARIERARREQSVALDCYPYAASSTVLRPERCDGSIRILVTWSRTHPEQAGRDLATIAAAWGCSESEAAERLTPAGAVYFAMDEGDLRRILSFSDTMIGSDGLPHDNHPHPRLWGTFPRVLGHYARELGLLSLEEAVHRMTALPAATLGLHDRGVIRKGAVADLTVFDPERIADRASYAHPTTTSGGIELVVTNGEPVWQAGAATGRLPGQFLQGVTA